MSLTLTCLSIPLLLYLEAGGCCGAGLLAILFFQGEPPSPPSASAALKIKIREARAQYKKSQALSPHDALELAQYKAAIDASCELPLDRSAKRPEDQMQQMEDIWRMSSYQHGTTVTEATSENTSHSDEHEKEDRLLHDDVTVPENIFGLPGA